MIAKGFCEFFKPRRLSIEAFEGDFPAVFDLIDGEGDPDSGDEHVIQGVSVLVLLKRQAFHKHPLNGERLFVNSSSEVLVQLNDLEALGLAHLSEDLKDVVARERQRCVQLQLRQHLLYSYRVYLLFRRLFRDVGNGILGVVLAIAFSDDFPLVSCSLFVLMFGGKLCEVLC